MINSSATLIHAVKQHCWKLILHIQFCFIKKNPISFPIWFFSFSFSGCLMETLFSILGLHPLLIHRQKLHNLLQRDFVLERDLGDSDSLFRTHFILAAESGDLNSERGCSQQKEVRWGLMIVAFFLSITLWVRAVLKMNYCHVPSSTRVPINTE